MLMQQSCDSCGVYRAILYWPAGIRNARGIRLSSVARVAPLALASAREMAIGGLFCCLDPGREARDVVIVGDESELQDFCRFQLQEQVAGLRNAEAVLRRLRENSDEPKLRNRAGCQLHIPLGNQAAYPGGRSLVEFMLEESERDERIDVRAGTSWEFVQNLAHLSAGQGRRFRPRAKNRKAGEPVHEDF